MSIKVLPLTGMMAVDPVQYDLTFEDMFNGKPRIEPVFHRNGFYYDRKTKQAWLEWYGNSVKTTVKQFQYELAVYHASELNERQIAALQAVVNEGMATKQQKDILTHYRHSVEQRNIERETKRFFMRHPL